MARLTEKHFLSHTPETAKGPKKNFLTRRCRVCHKNGLRKEVTHMCVSSVHLIRHCAQCLASSCTIQKRHTGSSNFVVLVDFYARKQLCFQRVLAIAILSIRLSVTRVDQAKTVQARISKFSPSAAWKTPSFRNRKAFL